MLERAGKDIDASKKDISSMVLSGFAIVGNRPIRCFFFAPTYKKIPKLVGYSAGDKLKESIFPGWYAIGSAQPLFRKTRTLY